MSISNCELEVSPGTGRHAEVVAHEEDTRAGGVRESINRQQGVVGRLGIRAAGRGRPAHHKTHRPAEGDHVVAPDERREQARPPSAVAGQETDGGDQGQAKGSVRPGGDPNLGQVLLRWSEEDVRVAERSTTAGPRQFNVQMGLGQAGAIAHSHAHPASGWILLLLRLVHLTGALHAHGLVVVLLGEALAVEGRWPGIAEALHHRMAADLDGLAEAAAGTDGVDGRLGRAHGQVGGAEEELQLGAAVVHDQRGEALQGHIHVRLHVVAHQVGHGGLVVADIPAHLDPNGLALAEWLYFGRRTGTGMRSADQNGHHHQQECDGQVRLMVASVLWGAWHRGASQQYADLCVGI